MDERGKVHYTDILPPDAANQGSTELGKSGTVVKKSESAEEKKKRLAAEAEVARRKRLSEEQARRDRALLSTYTTEKEIDLTRDRALEHHNLIIRSAQVRLKQLEPGLKELGQKIEAAAKNGKPAPAHLRQQYDAKRSEIEEAQRTIQINEEAMVKVRERFEAEKLRFRELTAKP